MTRFVILAVPRTGSNLLCTLLNSHPEILCHHEIFNPQGIFTALDYRDEAIDAVSLHDRDRSPMQFLERVWQARHDHRCIGFKWTRGQNETVLRNVVEDSGIKKIVLRRRNRIKTYVSERIAQQTQQWEVYHEQELVMPRPRITVDETDLFKHITLNSQFYLHIESSLRQTSQPFMDVFFESLFTPTEQTQILRFLEVSDHERPLETVSVRQNSMDLRHSVANFAELAETLQGGELEAELHDCGI